MDTSAYLSPAELREEADALTLLARRLGVARAPLAEPAQAISAHIARAVAAADPFAGELALEQAARDLRALWLRAVAAETASVLRTPTARETANVARRHDAYGYERELQPESLEARCARFFDAPPAGWHARHVLCSSGQAALTTTLMTLAAEQGALSIAHLGRYYETRALIETSFYLTADIGNANVVAVEPVACDGDFTLFDLNDAFAKARGAKAIIVDTTLSHRIDGLTAALHETRGDLIVIRLVSGLKMLQQGLELANVGVVSVHARDAAMCEDFAAALTHMRALIGSGLRFVDELALEAPFFLDRAATDAYEDAIFAHNAALARAVADSNVLFKPLTHPCLHEKPGDAPYCTFQPKDASTNVEALADRMAAEARARGLLFERGGSFGFRGHRFDVIAPETGEPAYLRVAMGRRAGPSFEGAIALMRDLASGRLG